MKRFLDNFVSLRFWLLPIFVSLYYLQLYIDPVTIIRILLRAFILLVLIAFLFIAILANRMWIEDFRRRIFSGLKFLVDDNVGVDEPIVLEQHRWAGAQIIAIILIILGGLWQLSEAGKFGAGNTVPILITALVISVALFDAALDLSAVQTMCLLAKRKKPEEKIGRLFFHTNQHAEHQSKLSTELLDETSPLHEAIRNNDASYLSYKTFSGQSQNLIAMAIVVVFYISAVCIYYLCKQFMYVWESFNWIG